METILTTYLLSKQEITALIDRRLFFDERSGKLPCVVIMNISDVKNHTHDGISNLERPIYQITVYADGKLNAKAISKQIKFALSDYSGNGVEWARLMTELCFRAQIDESNNADAVLLEFELYREVNKNG